MEVEVTFHFRSPDELITKEVSLSKSSDLEDVMRRVSSAFALDPPEKYHLYAQYKDGNDIVKKGILSVETFWELCSGSECVQFVICRVRFFHLRFFLSFDLRLNRVISIPEHMSWERILQLVAESFSNVAVECIESFIVMHDEGIENELDDSTMECNIIRNSESFWEVTHRHASESDEPLYIKVNSSPAYTIPLALADDLTFRASIKIPVNSTSWDDICSKISETFQLNKTSLSILHVALTDEDGDLIGSPITSARELYRRFLKSFDADASMKFLVFCNSRFHLNQSDDEIGKISTLFYDSRGNIRIRGVSEADLSNPAVFHISSEYTWEEILDAFCKPLSLKNRLYISYLQIWNSKGECIGPPIYNKEVFLEWCKKEYRFELGMVIVVILDK